MNFLILEPNHYSKEAIKTYASLGRIFLNNDSNFEKKEIDVLVVRLNQMIDTTFLSDFTNVKYIISPTTGLNHIDINVCQSKNIQIVSLRNCMDKIENVSSTTELNLGLMISLVRNMNNAINDVKVNSDWNRDKFRGYQLRDKNLGIIGLGRIGLAFAKICTQMGMNIFAFDPEYENEKNTPNGITLMPIPELLSICNIVSINANYDLKNKYLISFEEVDKMKPGIFIINTARGELLNEKAIIQGLKEKTIAGIAVDVLENEHKNNFLDHSLLHQISKEGYNVIITPHIGGCTKEAMEYTEHTIAEYFKESILK